MPKRKSIYNLPNCMAERAIWARNKAKEDPKLVHYDDQILPWVYSKKDNLWYSFDGNYSQYSPQEKREKELIAEQNEQLELIKINEQYVAQKAYSLIRIDVLERDNYTCQECGAIGNSKYHVHHIHKVSDGGQDVYDNLITLCPKCHYKADRELYNPDWIGVR